MIMIIVAIINFIFKFIQAIIVIIPSFIFIAYSENNLIFILQANYCSLKLSALLKFVRILLF